MKFSSRSVADASPIRQITSLARVLCKIQDRVTSLAYQPMVGKTKRFYTECQNVTLSPIIDSIERSKRLLQKTSTVLSYYTDVAGELAMSKMVNQCRVLSDQIIKYSDKELLMRDEILSGQQFSSLINNNAVSVGPTGAHCIIDHETGSRTSLNTYSGDWEASAVSDLEQDVQQYLKFAQVVLGLTGDDRLSTVLRQGTDAVWFVTNRRGSVVLTMISTFSSTSKNLLVREGPIYFSVKGHEFFESSYLYCWLWGEIYANALQLSGASYK